MRVMLNDNGRKFVLEITAIGYDDDIMGVKDDDGDFDRYKDCLIDGLFMSDVDGDVLYIAGVSKYKCDTICQEILETGFVDISGWGEFNYRDFDDKYAIGEDDDA